MITLLILQALMNCTSREDVEEANLRISSYEVINSYIANGAKDTLSLIGHLIPLIIERLMSTFRMSVMTKEDKEDQATLQGEFAFEKSVVIA